MEILSDDDLLNICGKLSIKDLETFMKTSKRIGQVCFYEWNKRHRKEFGIGHSYLTERRRNEIKECIKTSLVGKEWILQEVISRIISNPELVTSELLSIIKIEGSKLDQEVFGEIMPLYGEDAAYTMGIEWDETGYNHRIDVVSRKYLYRILDSIHADQSLVNFLTEINRFLGSEQMGMISC